MAHFAELDENNVVLRVIVVGNDDCLDENGNESEAVGAQFCTNLLGGRWVQTSYNANFRQRYAGQGYTYDEQNDWFVTPKPYPSWVMNMTDGSWETPVPMPQDNKPYVWDEETVSWVELAPGQ